MWKKKISWFVFLFILVSTMTIFFDVKPVKADGENWLIGWTYRKEITVSNNLDDYQTKITVDNASGGGGDANCSGHAKSDFSDLRFANASGNTLIPYWIENYTADTQATVWVNNSYNETTLYMYYGNDSASDVSDGSATFIEFDDQETGGNGNWVIDSHTSYQDMIIDTQNVNHVRGSYSTHFTCTGSNKGSWSYSLTPITSSGMDAFEFWVYNPDVSEYSSTFRIQSQHEISSAATGLYYSKKDLGGYKHATHDGGDWNAIGAFSDDTWYKVVITDIDLSSFTFDIAVYTVDGSLVGSLDDTGDYSSESSWTHLKPVDASSSFASDLYLDCIIHRSWISGTEPAFSFGAEETEQEEWSNNAPTITNENPTNQSTSQGLQPLVNVTVTDADGNQSTCDFYTSIDAESWTHVQTNSSVLNESISYHYTGANNYNTKYYWKITANDTHDNTTKVYEFTTKTLTWYSSSFGGTVTVNEPSNNLPELTNPSGEPDDAVASYTTIYFNITWADDDGESPDDGYLNVSIIKDGWSTNQTMTYITGDNTTGANYSYSTTLTAGEYNYTFYASDGTDTNSSGPHEGLTVVSQSYSFTVETTSNGNFDFKDWTLGYTGVGKTTEYNVSEDNQTSENGALTITNTGNIPLNFTMNWTSTPGTGITMKYNTEDTAPNPTVNSIAVDPETTQIITNLATSTAEELWIWIDFINVGAQTSSGTIKLTSSKYGE